MTSSRHPKNPVPPGLVAPFAGRRTAFVWSWCALGLLSMFACQPDAFLGTDGQVTVGMGGAAIESGGSAPVGDLPANEQLTEAGGAASTEPPSDTTFIQGHECSVVQPGESHDEPIAVCCQMSAEEDAWRDEVMVEINAARVRLGVEPFLRDPALDQAAMAWAMHWWLHWDPIEKSGYPVDYTVPEVVAAACGTTASTLVMTNTQSEPRLANGLIDSTVPAERWTSSSNFYFDNPDYVRIGIGFYDGLLLGLFDRVETP